MKLLFYIKKGRITYENNGKELDFRRTFGEENKDSWKFHELSLSCWPEIEPNIVLLIVDIQKKYSALLCFICSQS